jgi:hypothetical protein
MEVINLIRQGVFSFKLFNFDKYEGRLFKSYIVQEIKGKGKNKKPYKKSYLIV